MTNIERVESIRRRPPFRVWDIAAALLVILIAVIFFIVAPKTVGDCVKIYSDGALVAEKLLSADTVFDIESAYGVNTVKIFGGKVCVLNADCSNGSCIATGWISRSGESIVCLPHKLVIEIVSQNDDGIDGVT